MDELASAQNLLSEGDAQAAVECLERVSKSSGLGLDGHLLMAEALWTRAGPGGTEAALPHYEAALTLAGSDVSKKATVSLGYGFALLQLKHLPRARQELLKARSLAEEDGNAAAAQFVDSLLQNTESTEAATLDDAAKATWLAFAGAYANDERPVLFMRGTIHEPLDAASAHGVEKLRASGAKSMKVVDLSETGPDLPGGLQTLADVGIELPQLYLKGAAVEHWMGLETGELRRRLEDSGVAMKDPDSEPCHGTFSDGLADWEVALVEMISVSGPGDWEEKAKALTKKGFEDAPKTAGLLEEAWQKLAPSIKTKLESQPEMPCGHSCNTCPTKHDCQLHDAVGHVRDIEDLI
ncbi:unnamed protein product [Symbiodinium natans]|uniref:Uncharacterized protein n=1 Tax=Symbiodinium natans TaxID=878477 RepID=A0A812JK82_9DINO|nr:unnamed protein product [Symbiodinium natans]